MGIRFSEVLWEVMRSDGCFVDGKYWIRVSALGLTATVRLCCNSAGHSNRDSTNPLGPLKEKPFQ